MVISNNMIARELDLFYRHPSTPNSRTRILARPIALDTLAKYSGLFHDLCNPTHIGRKSTNQTSPAVEAYTLCGPSLSAFRTVFNWILRSANLTATATLQSGNLHDGQGPFATMNFRTKSYMTLAQLRLSAKILRIPFLERVLLSRMQQLATEKPLITNEDLEYLLGCGDYKLTSTTVTILVHGLAGRYMRYEQAGLDYQKFCIWNLVSSQNSSFTEAFEKALRKRRAALPLPGLNLNAKTAEAGAPAFQHGRALSAPERSKYHQDAGSRHARLEALPTMISPLSSCSCICTCEDSQLRSTHHSDMKPASTYEYIGPGCPTCCPVQRANRAFFKTGLNNANDPFIDHELGLGAKDKVRDWQLGCVPEPEEAHNECPETPTKSSSRHKIRRTDSSKRPPMIDVSLANFTPPLTPSPIRVRSANIPPASSTPAYTPPVPLPPSPTKTINVIVPPFSPISTGTIIRKTYDEEGNEKLEMVRPKRAVEKERSRLKEGLNEYVCCSVM